MTRLAPALLAACLALVAVLAAGCGGDDARDVLRATFAEAEPVRSGTVALAVRVDATGVERLPSPLAIDLSGPFDSRREGRLPQFDLDLALRTGDSTLRTGAVSTGDRGWLKLEDQAYTLGEDVLSQLRQNRKGASRGLDLRSLGVDPSRWLRDPETVGTDSVSGVEATHVRGDVDVPRLLEDLDVLLGKAKSLGLDGGAASRRLTDEQREQIEKSVQDATVDVWSGRDDRRLRRLRVEVRFDVPEEVRGEGKPEQRGSVRLDLRLGELDRPQSIVAPKDARPLSELQQGLAAIAGALQDAQGGAPRTGGDPAAGAGAPGGANAAPSAATPYERCLAEAGGDLRAQQDCAALLAG